MTRWALILALSCVSAPALAEDQASGEAPPEAEAEAEAEAGADPVAAPEEESELDPDLLAGAEVIEISGSVTPGSEHEVSEEALERYEHDDVHQILSRVPGVYIREEEGYGLRPNIGMRGSGSERSRKVALMEDGVPIAPAPYSAPAAYYFPLVTRMQRLEVEKGPAAIRYGPNTVGGAVNMVSKEIPGERRSELDLAAGQDFYTKLYGSHAERSDHFGVLIEGIKLRADGFKEIDGGGETGFDKNSVQLKARANTDTSSTLYHQVDLKLGYSDEVSHETYTGLTDEDFDDAPYRRYAATRRDKMEWEHTALQISHRVEVGAAFDLTTDVYRNDFHRVWRKLNGFDTDTSLAEILANPDAGNNAVFYDVLTGQSDSSSQAETLLIGANDRTFVSQGVQTVGHTQREWLGATHDLHLGLRLHYDEAVRFHTEEGFQMLDGELARTEQPMRVNKDATGSTVAFASFFQERMKRGPLTVTAGLRTEVIGTEWEDRRDPAMNDDDSYAVFIPGGGVHYQVLPGLSVLGGVHRGFVPVTPGPQSGADPESSINYEAGVRWDRAVTRAEVIGFFNDYDNLLGTCTFSAGCGSGQIGDEFNGGEVNVYGAEALGSVQLGGESTLGVVFPIRLSYTYTRSEFQSDFSSSNPLWGDVEAGDEMPYLPYHLLSAEIGARAESWEISAAARYTGTMRNTAGQGEAPPEERAGGYTVVDLAAHYRIQPWGHVYVTLSNLFDQAQIVSRRPFGARPGRPRYLIAGYKNEF